MTLFDDTIESYIERKDKKYSPPKVGKKIPKNQSEVNEEDVLKVLKKLKVGIVVGNITFTSIEEAKREIERLKAQRKKFKTIAMDQNEINMQCIESNKSFDEVIQFHQSRIDKINIHIKNIRDAFLPIPLD